MSGIIYSLANGWAYIRGGPKTLKRDFTVSHLILYSYVFDKETREARPIHSHWHQSRNLLQPMIKVLHATVPNQPVAMRRSLMVESSPRALMVKTPPAVLCHNQEPNPAAAPQLLRARMWLAQHQKK